MNKTAGTMAKTIAAGTQRNFYYKSSYADYQTYSELIDYTYGKFGIHSYTVEVYSGGSSSDSAYNPNRDFTSDAGCMWNNTLPATKTVYYTHDEAVKILQAAGVDPAKLKVMECRQFALSYAIWKLGIKPYPAHKAVNDALNTAEIIKKLDMMNWMAEERQYRNEEADCI